MSVCLKCGGTGWLVNGDRCDCGIQDAIILPTSLRIPSQYQDIRFNRMNLRPALQSEYGSYIESLINEISAKAGRIDRNILICAQPNSGKTVLAYTVIGSLFAKGVKVPEVMDLMQIREILMARYNTDVEKIADINSAPIMFVKIPMDVPARFAETMSMLIERRVRFDGSTIFLFSGSAYDLEALDTFGKYQRLLGDGSFNSIQLKNFGGNDASS